MRAGLTAALALLATVALAQGASAQGCRAREIMASQCTWFVLEELKSDSREAERAQKEATSDLVGGCTQGEYQMVLLRGTGLADQAIADLRRRGARGTASVRKACSDAARAVPAR